MKKRIMAFTAAVLCVFTSFSAYADESGGESVVTISIQQAIEMAVKDNPELISYDTQIEDAQRQIEQAKKDLRDSKGPVPLPSGIGIVALRKGYYVNQYTIAKETAEMQKEQAINNIAYDVTEKYCNVKLLEALVENMKNSYDLTLQNVQTLQTQYDLGMASELDIKNAMLSLSQVKASLEEYKRNFDIAKKSLLVALQIEDENTNLNLTDSIEYKEADVDFENDVESALESRVDMFSLKKAYEQAQLYCDATKVLGVDSSQYSAANSTVVQCEYRYSNSKKLMRLALNTYYNNILTCKDNLDIAKEKYELKEQEYSVNKLKYDLGLITSSELFSSRTAADSAAIEYENAKLAYRLACEKYSYEITLGL